MLKLNALFHSSQEKDRFTDKITPEQEKRDFLLECKNAIRDHLRPRIAEATVLLLGMKKRVEPRFRTQGSWSYKTCILPATMPPQEMDWDFGVYLPVDIWEQNGPPAKMAQAYFKLVESLLDDLCQDKGWELIQGKNTCIRVKVADWAHIDIPLYAAPEKDFVEITERTALSKALNGYSEESYPVFDNIQEQQWVELDEIVMATRSGEWVPSDPADVSNWFDDRIREHTEQLRRICRYLKAWRDFHWKDGGPTSISIMIAAARKFQHIRGRDDLVLENAAEQLGEAFAGEIREPGIDDGREDFNRLPANERPKAVQLAKQLAKTLRDARYLHNHEKVTAISMLQMVLGDRIPDMQHLIETDSGADAVRTTAAQQVSQPNVHATKAG